MVSRRWKGTAWALAAWASLVRRRARAIVALVALVVVGLGAYAAATLGINADTTAMLADSLPWRQDAIAYDRAYPEDRDTLLAVVEAPTPEAADRARDALALALRADGSPFAQVRAPQADPFFQRHALLYMDTGELAELEGRLSVMQPFLGRLALEPGLVAFLETAAQAADAPALRGQPQLGAVYAQLALAMRAAAQGRASPTSWRALVLDEGAQADTPRTLLRLTPAANAEGLASGAQSVRAAREAADALRAGDERVRVRLTGPLALRYEEFRGLKRDSLVMGLVAFALVAALLYGALRSGWLVTASLLTVAGGLVLTSAFAAAAVGELNLISVAFAAIFIGAAIDYPIHLGLRYQELAAEGRHAADALARALGDVGPSLVICTATTALGLFAFLPTSFVGVAELGLIAGVGMVVGLVMSVTLFPALLALREPRRPDGPWTPGRLGIGAWVARLGMLEARRHRTAVRVGCLLLALAAAAAGWFARFDANRLNLRDQGSESVSAMRDLIADERFDPMSAVALVPGAARAADLALRLEALPEVRAARTLASFVPEDQDAKLAVVDRLSLTLGLLPETLPPPPPETPDDQLDALRTLRDELRAAGSPLAQAGELAAAADDLIQRAEQADPQRRRAMLDALSDSLLGEFGPLLARLARALTAGPVSVDDLPPWLADRWRLPDGRHRVEALPRDDLRTPRALARFAEAVGSVAPGATGPPIVAHRAGRSIVDAFLTALTLAGVAIAGVLAIAFRGVRSAAIVLAAVAMAAALTLATSVVLGVAFNFANVIAMPLVLGLGVDSAVHVVHRARAEGGANLRLARTATARGVVFSALTTIAGFAGLLFSGHAGTASMAHLLMPGVAFTAACALVLVPALLPPRGEF